LAHDNRYARSVPKGEPDWRFLVCPVSMWICATGTTGTLR